MLKNKNFRLYALGRLVSVLGDGMHRTAVILYILDLTGSGTMLGLFGIINTIPRLLMLPFSGVIGDILDRRKIMIVCDIVSGLLITVMAALSFLDILTINTVFVIQVGLVVAGIMFRSSTRAMIPDLVANENLNQANAVLKGIGNFSDVVGPVLGAAIYSFWGIRIVFLLNGISFLISGLSETFIKYENPPCIEKSSDYSMLLKIKEGFNYIGSSRNIKQICMLYIFSSSIVLPVLTVVLPFTFKEFIGFTDQQFSLLESSYVIGMLIGSVLLASLLRSIKSKWLIRGGLTANVIAMFLISGLVMPVFSRQLNGNGFYFTVWCLVLIIYGGSDIIFDTPVETNLQLMIPENLRSRVLASTQLLFGLGIPIGQTLYGILLDKYPVYTILPMMSLAYFLAVTTFLIFGSESIYSGNIVKGEVDLS